MERSQRKSKVLRLLSLLLVLGVCFTLAQGVLKTREYAYVYDLPAEELQEDLEKYITSSVDVSMEDQISSRQWGLTGACKLGTLSLASSEAYQVRVHAQLGKAKVAIQPTSGQLLLLEPNEETTLPLDAGTYDVYCVGRYFLGKVDVAPAAP